LAFCLLDTGRQMEGAFMIPALVLVLSMILSMAGILRDVMPHRNEDDQVFLPGWFGSQERRLGIRETLSRQFRFDRLFRKVWDQHARLFPKSRKRAVFASLLVGSGLQIFAYPLWLALAGR
jgi:hypothetical protein